MKTLLKLRHLLIALIGLLAAISLIAIGWHIATARAMLAETDRQEHANHLDDLVMQATINNGMERGLTTILLANDVKTTTHAAQKTQLRQLRERDRELHAGIEAELGHLLRIADTGLRTAAAQAGQKRQQLEEARRQADACFAGQDCRIAAPHWIDVISTHVAALAALRRAAAVPHGEGNALALGTPLSREVIYTLIEYAGRERAQVGAAIAARRPLTPTEMETLLGYRGVITETMQKVDAMVARLPAESEIIPMRATIRDAYQEHFEALRQAVYAASARGQPYPVDADVWFAAATAGIDSLAALAGQVDRLASENIARTQDRATLNLWSYALAGLATVAILLMAFLLVRQRVLRPLLRLEDAAHTIAGGDLQQPVSGFRDDEFGEVAAAFETMRANLLAQVHQRNLAVEQAEQLRRVVEQTDDLVIVSDSRGIIEYVNAAFERVTGYRRKEVIGQHARLLKSGQHDAVFYQSMWRTLKAGDPFQARMIDRRKDGGLYHCEKTISPLRDEHGAITHYVCTAKDVTERHRLDEQLRQSEKLASIGQLAAGVAHEINNPVGFVNSNLASLARYFEKLLRVLEHFESSRELIAGTGEAGRVWLTEVEALQAEADYTYLKDDIPALLAESRDGLTRVRQIVQDLRDFSRADNREEWEPVDLCAGLESTLNILRNEIKHHADVVKVCSGLPKVECLPGQINQVFMNLLANAAQAIPDNRRGTIGVRCGQTGDAIWFEIEDDGAGIAPENLKKIFDPFFTTKPVGKGTGLGLALSYGIVEKHGGRIEVESEVGKGTLFRIVLPKTRPTAVPPAPTFDDAATEPPVQETNR